MIEKESVDQVTLAIYDLEGNFLQTVVGETVSQIARELKVSYNSLRDCLLGRINSTKNRQFRTVISGRVLKRVGDVSGLGVGMTPVQVSKFFQERYICSYNSIEDAAKLNGIDEGDISKCCGGQRSTAGGFSWKYSNPLK